MRTRSQRFVLAGLIAALYVYCFPYFEGMRSANELPRIYLTQAMVDEGTFAIDTGVARWGKTADMSPSGGRLYSNKAPGTSLLAVPAYLVLKGIGVLRGEPPSLAEMTWAFRFSTGIVPSLLFLLLLWRFLGRFAPRPETRRLLIFSYAVGSMAMTYSVLFIAHQVAAVLMGTAYILSVWVAEEGRPRKWMWVAGLCAGAAPLMDYQAAFAGIPLAIYVVYKLAIAGRYDEALHLQSRERGTGKPRGRRDWAALAYAVLGALPPIAFLLFYHDRAFGSPWTTGYAASETFAHFHQEGFLGMDRFRLEALAGSMVAPDNGLLLFSPMVLLAIPGWFILARKQQWWHLGITLSVALIYIGFISSIIFWRGGWQVGPRYITAMLPFLLVPIAAALSRAERDWRLRAGAIALLGVGVIVYGVSTAVFPHFPEKFSNPVHGLVFRLLADGEVAYNAAYLVGLSGLVSVLPYLALLGGGFYWAACPSPDQRRSALVGIALAVLIVALYRLFPSGGAAEERAYEWVRSVMPS